MASPGPGTRTLDTPWLYVWVSFAEPAGIATAVSHDVDDGTAADVHQAWIEVPKEQHTPHPYSNGHQ
jgi:hypothetical protein